MKNMVIDQRLYVMLSLLVDIHIACVHNEYFLLALFIPYLRKISILRVVKDERSLFF